jgi:putative transposase
VSGADTLQVAIALWRDGGFRCRKLNALEYENRRLKKLLAESMLDAAILKEMLGKNF